MLICNRIFSNEITILFNAAVHRVEWGFPYLLIVCNRSRVHRSCCVPSKSENWMWKYSFGRGSGIQTIFMSVVRIWIDRFLASDWTGSILMEKRRVFWQIAFVIGFERALCAFECIFLRVDGIRVDVQQSSYRKSLRAACKWTLERL